LPGKPLERQALLTSRESDVNVDQEGNLGNVLGHTGFPDAVRGDGQVVNGYGAINDSPWRTDFLVVPLDFCQRGHLGLG
jgi:hypothetical protein